MKTINQIKILAVAIILSTSVSFAQPGPGGRPPMGGQDGMPPPPQNGEVNVNTETEGGAKPGGFFQRMFGEMRGERKENRQEFRENKMEAREDFRENMMATGTATGTAWKEMREDMKNARGEWKDNMEQMRDDMRGRMASITAKLTDAQLTQISAKVGLTVEAIRAQLASGTPLREIVKDKLTREEMNAIIPMPMMGSSTLATGTQPREDRGPRGFFNQLRNKLFGGTENAPMDTNSFASTTAEGSGQQEPVKQFREFFKRLFNF